MKKRITVFCKDKYLRQKIFLILSESHLISFANPASPEKDLRFSDLVIWNTEDSPLPDEPETRFLTLGDGGDLSLPFTEETLIGAVDSDVIPEPAPLMLGDRCAWLHGDLITFTEVEFALLSALVAANGEFISREALIQEVWGDGTTPGVLNVYVHYLREKLEFRGEKIIISSRKQGYKVDEKYLKGGENA